MKTTAIGKKLIPNIIVVIIVLGLVNIISFYYIKRINTSYSDLIDHRAHILAAVNDVQNDMYEQTASYRGYLLTNNPEYMKKFDKLNKRVNEELDNVRSLIKGDVNKEKIKKLTELNHIYKQKAEKVIGSMSPDHSAAVSLFESSVVPISQEMIKQAQFYADDQLSYMDGVSDANDETAHFSTEVLLIISSIGFLIAILLITYISRSVLMKLTID